MGGRLSWLQTWRDANPGVVAILWVSRVLSHASRRDSPQLPPGSDACFAGGSAAAAAKGSITRSSCTWCG